jgi:Holliday junction resolvasome RuvABC endonuclease subunit
VRALGLDPSLSAFGWCVYDSAAGLRPRRLVASGHEGTLSDLVPVARFMHARSMVDSLLRRFDVDVVGIESPAFDGGPFTTTHYSLMMFATEPIFERRKDFVLFDPTTLKLVSTGKSTASKADMQRAVQIDRMSTEVIQSDESDAYHVAKSAARFLMLWRGELSPDDLTEHEKRVFLMRTKKPKRASSAPVRKVAHVFRQNSRFFELSKVPVGSVSLPDRSEIRPELLEWLTSSDVIYPSKE